MKKKFAIIGCLCLILGSTVGCSLESTNVDGVNITFLSSKPEIEIELQEVVEQFTAVNEDAEVKLVQYSRASTSAEKLNSLRANQNMPTMTLIDPNYIQEIADESVSLNEEPWLETLAVELPDIAYNSNNELIAFPFTVEGVGLIYNKKVIQEAGINIDAIKTQEALEDAFKKIEATGKKAIAIANETWSLGDHFMATGYSASQTGEGATSYFDKLSKGQIKIETSAQIQGVLDTFEIMKAYNIFKEAPLFPSYDKCAEVMAKGQVGFWYMGNWAYNDIISKSDGNVELGMIPLPISNNPQDEANNKIATSVTKYIVIDQANNSPEQQEMAKRFINWMMTSEAGHKFLIEDAKVIPAFSNLELKDTNDLIDSVMNYQEKQQTMQMLNAYLPQENSNVIGNALRKYLNNEINRQELNQAIQDFWLS